MKRLALATTLNPVRRFFAGNVCVDFDFVYFIRVPLPSGRGGICSNCAVNNRTLFINRHRCLTYASSARPPRAGAAAATAELMQAAAVEPPLDYALFNSFYTEARGRPTFVKHNRV